MKGSIGHAEGNSRISSIGELLISLGSQIASDFPEDERK